MKSSNLRLIECTDMRPVGRKPNAAYRVREHLTEGEMTKLLAALKTEPPWSSRLADGLTDLSARAASE